MTGNKKVFRSHLSVRLLRNTFYQSRSRRPPAWPKPLNSGSVVLNYHLALVEEVTLKYVSVVALMHFARCCVGRECYGRWFIIRSTLITPGFRVCAFGMCHFVLTVCSLQYSVINQSPSVWQVKCLLRR